MSANDRVRVPAFYPSTPVMGHLLAPRLPRILLTCQAVQQSHPNQRQDRRVGALPLPSADHQRARESQTGCCPGLIRPRLVFLLTVAFQCPSSFHILLSATLGARSACPSGSPALFPPGESSLPSDSGRLTIGQAGQKQQQQEEPQERLQG